MSNCNGPMHGILALLNSRGMIFSDVHNSAMIHPYRSGKKAKDFIQRPSDPRQALNEGFSFSYAVLTEAVYMTQEYKNERVNGKTSITASDVFDHMLACAKEDINELFILFELRIIDILAMMVESKKTKGKDINGKDIACNPDMFRSAMRVSLVLFATTNRNKYVRLVADNIVEWECASDADKVLYDHFCFCAKTGHMKPIFLDEFMEWNVMETRDVHGKFKTSRRMHEHLTTTALNMAKRMRVKQELKQDDSCEYESTTDSVDLDYLFMHTRILARKICMWKLGKDRKTTQGKPRPVKFTSLDGKNKIAPSLVNALTVADKRLEKYFDEYYITGELHQVPRPQKIVRLARIPVLATEKEASDKDIHNWLTSTTVSHLEKFGKDDLISNFDELNAELDDSDKERRPAVYKNRNVWSTAICTVRKKLKKDYSMDEFADADQLDAMEPITISQTLEHRLFNVSPSVRSRFAKLFPIGRVTTPPVSPACHAAAAIANTSANTLVDNIAASCQDIGMVDTTIDQIVLERMPDSAQKPD